MLCKCLNLGTIHFLSLCRLLKGASLRPDFLLKAQYRSVRSSSVKTRCVLFLREFTTQTLRVKNTKMSGANAEREQSVTQSEVWSVADGAQRNQREENFSGCRLCTRQRCRCRTGPAPWLVCTPRWRRLPWVWDGWRCLPWRWLTSGPSEYASNSSQV